MEILQEIMIHNMLVKLHGIENPIRCRIIHDKTTETDTPFHFEVEF